jgi:hypothetical protein
MALECRECTGCQLCIPFLIHLNFRISKMAECAGRLDRVRLGLPTVVMPLVVMPSVRLEINDVVASMGSLSSAGDGTFCLCVLVSSERVCAVFVSALY